MKYIKLFENLNLENITFAKIITNNNTNSCVWGNIPDYFNTVEECESAIKPFSERCKIGEINGKYVAYRSPLNFIKIISY